MCQIWQGGCGGGGGEGLEMWYMTCNTCLGCSQHKSCSLNTSLYPTTQRINWKNWTTILGTPKWHFGCLNQNSETTFQHKLPPTKPLKRYLRNLNPFFEKWFFTILPFFFSCPNSSTYTYQPHLILVTTITTAGCVKNLAKCKIFQLVRKWNCFDIAGKICVALQKSV